MFRFGSRSLSGSIAFGLLLLGPLCHAQTVQLSPATFQIKREVVRPTGEFPYVINYEDCIKSLEPDEKKRTEIQIRPVISNWDRNRDQLEVWVSASQNCKTNTERTSTGRCRQVAAKRPTTTSELITFRPIDVVAAVNAPGTDPVFTGKGTEDVCESALSATLSIYVMFIAGGEVQGSEAKWDKSQIDVAAPTVPKDLNVQLGDQALFPRWEAVTDTDINGFNVFCEQIACTGGTPPPASGSDGAAGAAGASGVVDPSCTDTPSVLKPGRRLSSEDAARYACGTSTGRATSDAAVTEIQGAPPQNGSCYALAVASKDIHANVSVLSDVSCGTPKDVTTFYEAYSDAGGRGGGKGFCQIGAASATSSAMLLGAIAGLLGKLRTRGTRRKRTAQ